MNINFTETGWRDYVYWENQDKKTIKRINNLIEDIGRNGHNGIGKSEPLRNDLPVGGRAELTKRTVWYIGSQVMN